MFRRRPQVTDSTPAATSPQADPNLVAALELVRTTVEHLARAVDHLTAPMYAPAPADAPMPGETPELDVLGVDFDPTDDDPFLRDTTFAPFVPRHANEPGPKITHPLGIPGLVPPVPIYMPTTLED